MDTPHSGLIAGPSSMTGTAARGHLPKAQGMTMKKPKTKRWMKSVIESGRSDAPALPFSRTMRRNAGPRARRAETQLPRSARGVIACQ